MVVLLIYIAALFFFWRKGKRTALFCKGLYLAYMISAIAGLLFMFLDNTKSVLLDVTNYLPLLFLLFIVVLWSVPYRRLTPVPSCNNSDDISFINFNGVCTIVIIIFLPLSFLLLYNAFNVMTSVDVSSFRVDADYYHYFVGGIIFSLAVYVSMLSFIPQFLLFLSYRYNVTGAKRLFLLICSLSFAFMTLCFAGRDGIVYWIMNSIVFYLFLKESYRKSEKKELRRMLIIVGAAALVVFAFITFYRFFFTGGTDILNAILPILSYAGQPVHIFCQTMSLSENELGALVSTDYLTYTFGTFVKALYLRYGIWSTIAISIIQMLIINRLVTEYNKTPNLWSFFIIYTLYQIPFYGVFYYRQGIQSMELVYLIAICGLFILKKLKINTVKI